MPPLQSIRPVHNKQQQFELHRTRKKLNWPVFLFFVALLWPCVLFLGPLRLSLYRIVLLVMILPCLAKFTAGRAGIRISDVAVLLFAFWRVLALIVVNGIESSAQTIGIEWLETVGPYFLARCFIRDVDDFYNTILLLFRLVLVLFPFAVIEFVSGQNISRELVAMICQTPFFRPDQRSGFTRVQSVFDHPILFGVFAAGAFAMVHLVLGYKKTFPRRYLMTGTVAITASLSLSAGPLIAVIAQGLLLAWNSLLKNVKNRWHILVGLSAVIVLLIEVIANRSLPGLVSSYLTFDDQSYWYRLVIWDYGSMSVANHPIFGVGLSDWERPKWMPASIDNFWLYLAIRSGLPAPILLQLALLSVFLALAFKKGLDERTSEYRTALLIAMSGLFLVSWTVHYWDTAYVVFLFLMGSGAWILDAGTKEGTGLRLSASPVR
jgi:hypothetical protein